MTWRILPLMLFPLLAANAQSRYDAVVGKILDAWKTADIVCLGEDHGRFYDSELRIALAESPEFARIVRVIVIESANPVHQDLLDHFILEGREMSRAELAPIWRDASGPEVWEGSIYEKFLRTVREANLQLPRDRRVRIIAGDSPINWGRIKTAADLAPLVNRGGNIRNLISQQILEPHLKALAIYGAGHCTKVGGGFPGELSDKYGAQRFWSIWSLAGKGAQRGREVFGLGSDPSYLVIDDSKWAKLPSQDFIEGETAVLGDVLDAIVYHGNVPDSVVRPDLTDLNNQYGAELKRRAALIREALPIWVQSQKH